MSKTQMSVRYVFVGVTTAMVYFGLTFTLVELVHAHEVVASTVSYVLTVCYNYLLHYHWTFATDAPHGQALFRYLVMHGIGVWINGVVMHLGVTYLPVHYMVVQFIAAVAVICFTLPVSALWAFARR